MENSASSSNRNGAEVFSEELDFGSWPTTSGRQTGNQDDAETGKVVGQMGKPSSTDDTESIMKDVFSEDFDFGEESDVIATSTVSSSAEDQNTNEYETNSRVRDGEATQMETEEGENVETNATNELPSTDMRKIAQISVDGDDIEHGRILEANEAQEQQPIDNNDAIEDQDESPHEQPHTEGTKDAAEIRLVQFPLARIKQLMKLDPSVSIITAEALYVVAKASELFLQTLAKESYTHTTASKKKTIAKRDVEQSIESVDSLAFLEGMMNIR